MVRVRFGDTRGVDWLSLTDLADEGSFARGEDYAARGLVTITSATERVVEAVARGESTYDVRLHQVSWECTCPVGIGGAFCKHLVATALIVSGDTVPDPVDDAGPDGLDAMAGWMAGLDDAAARTVLAELDAVAFEALARVAARATGDVSAYAVLVDSIKTRRFMDWRAANDHGRQAHEVVAELERALAPATAAALLPLIEKGIGYLVKAIGRSDDSSGIQGDAARRLIALHAQAALLARPDERALARWLVRMTVGDQDFFAFDVVGYGDALGSSGLAAYRSGLEKHLAQHPDAFWAHYGLERLAVREQDVDAVVRLVGRGLEGPHRYLSLVEALIEAGDRDLALRYALEGTGSRLVPHQTVLLYDAAVRLLVEGGEHEEVFRLRREQLTKIPDETSYAALRKAATRLSRWPVERLAALDVLLQQNPRAWLAILVKEDQVDLAWQASRDMKLDDAMRLTLLRARATTRPEEVFDGYVTLIDGVLATSGQQNYRQAVAHLGELRKACAAAGTGEAYAAHVRRLLETHRRRPTLVAMLERMPS